MCFDVSTPIRLICSMDGLLCLRSTPTSFRHARCRRGPSTPTESTLSDFLKEPEQLPRLRYFVNGYRRSRLYREISAARNQAVKLSRYWRICSCSIWARRQCCSLRRGTKSSACLPSTIVGVIPIVRKLPLRRIGPHRLSRRNCHREVLPFPVVVYLGTWRDFSITDRPAFLALDKAEGPSTEI